MTAARYYVCERGHVIATPHQLDECPLAICETPLRETTANGNPKRQPKDTEQEADAR